MAQSIAIPDFYRNKTFLVDTNFFIDSYSHKRDFLKFIQEFKESDIALVSINLVKYEFIRSKTKDVINQKLIYFGDLIESILPFDIESEKLVVGIMEEYRDFIERVPITDLHLAATLKRYKGLYLLTRDHLDFPTTIFSREEIFCVESVRDIKPYALYTYKSGL